MAKRSFSLFALGLGALALGTALLIVAEWRHSQPAPRPAAPRPEVLTGAGPFFPLPSAMPLDARKVELGRNLFQDRRLSGDGSVSCASCHDLARGGVDRLAHSRGIGGREGAMNAPTVFNSGFNFRQFWDGRARTLEEQVDGPLHSDVEMGSNWPLVLLRLGADPAMVTAFGTLYPNGLQPANVRDALATFERSLVTPNSRFDRFLRGDSQALNAEEVAGYHLFQRTGCASCHQGVNLGGNLYQKLGIAEEFFSLRGNVRPGDLGRYNQTQREEDRHFFKVPTLRNVAATGPYLHDGSVGSLEEVVATMARFQLGVRLDPVDLSRLVAFLRTLNGEYLGKTVE